MKSKLKKSLNELSIFLKENNPNKDEVAYFSRFKSIMLTIFKKEHSIQYSFVIIIAILLFQNNIPENISKRKVVKKNAFTVSNVKNDNSQISKKQQGVIKVLVKDIKLDKNLHHNIIYNNLKDYISDISGMEISSYKKIPDTYYDEAISFLKRY